MRFTFPALLITATVLSACGGGSASSLNPFNWFGRSRSEAAPTGPVNPLIPQRAGGLFRRPVAPYAGEPVATIRELHVERVAGGAIIRVKGIAATQGYHDARLVKDKGAAATGALSYTLRAVRSPDRELIGPERGREIVAAAFVTDNDLAGIRTIRVNGARNARSSARRF